MTNFSYRAAFLAALLFSFSGMLLLSFMLGFAIKPKGKIVNVEISSSYPVMTKEERDSTIILYVQDTTRIFYYKDFVLYKLPGVTQFETNTYVPGTNPWFFYEKKHSSGYWIANFSKLDQPVRMPLDSFQKKYERHMDLFDASLIKDKSTHDIERGTLTEQYFPKIKKDETTPDSICIYFDKGLNDIVYSFSPKMDSLYGMKLYQIRIVYNLYFSKSQNKNIPKREFCFNMRKVVLKDAATIQNLFDKFIKIQPPH